MSEHISAIEAQALLDAATPGEWEWRSFSGDVVRLHDDNPPTLVAALFNRADQQQAEHDAAVIVAAKRALREVVRLRRELDARTDQPTVDELQAALNVQFDAPVPVPAHWQPIQRAAYRDGWLDAMQRVKDSTDTAAAARLLGGGE